MEPKKQQKQMMALGLGLASALVLVLLLIFGWLMPRGFTVSDQVTIKASAAILYPYLADMEKFPLWSPHGEAGKVTLLSARLDEWDGLDEDERDELDKYHAAVSTRLDFGSRGQAWVDFTVISKGDFIELHQSLRMDAGWNLSARYHNREFEKKLRPEIAAGLQALKNGAETDAHLSKAQEAANADSIPRIPLDTLSTEVKTAE